MRTVIVYNELRYAIYRKVDEALEAAPEFRSERESIYRDILAYYDEHGTIPDFSLRPAQGGERDE